MQIRCIWEHNGNDTLLYAVDFPGAYTRGETKEIAEAKIMDEILSYCSWSGKQAPHTVEIEIVQEKESDLNICDADSDVIFDSEKETLTWAEYSELKELALKSAADFLALYNAVPDKNVSAITERKTFYGPVPRTAEEMYNHTRNVNEYYFGEIETDAKNDGTILECRKRGFENLEAKADFLSNPVFAGSYGEEWSLRKLLRRFVWHDRIHAKAMYRMAVKTFGVDSIPDIFKFCCL